MDAAIWLAPQTGRTGTAREIGAYCAVIAFHQMEHVCSDSHDFSTEFMAKNLRIRKEWLIAMKGVVVSSTDTDLSNANQCLCRFRHRWIRKSNHLYLPRSIKAK